MLKFSAHLGYLFTEYPLEDRFRAAKDAGFAAIEHPSPYRFGTSRFRILAQEVDLPCAQIAAPAGDPKENEKGLACLAGRQDDFKASIKIGIRGALDIGAPLLHVMPGVLVNGMDRESCRDIYLENLTWAADECAAANLKVLIEPISDETVPGFYVNHPAFALSLITELNHSSVGLLFDVYHAAVKGIDPVKFIKDHIDVMLHIQIADHPGRHEPGSGILAYADVFQVLDDLDYTGFVGGEYKPKYGTLAGLKWMQEATA